MSFAGEWCTGQQCHPCDTWCPQPLATSCNDPCIVSCRGSRVIIYPPPVVVTFPGPILSTCPQETVVGSSAVLEGCAPTLQTSWQAEVACSEPPAERVSPRYESQGPPISSYMHLSHWIHPCNRPSYRRYQSSGSQKEEHPPEKEKPETENIDTENAGTEETETSDA